VTSPNSLLVIFEAGKSSRAPTSSIAARASRDRPSNASSLAVKVADQQCLQGAPQHELTVGGLERVFGTNYLGPLALTLPALLRIAKPRGVTVASSASKLGKIDFDKLQKRTTPTAKAQKVPARRCRTPSSSTKPVVR
jgi:NAD(P)-dependent dehydrogenase (short-subunit alcohol dehydrogenase family)